MPEFQVNTRTVSDQSIPEIISLSNGGFIITWNSYGQDGSDWGVYAQRYNIIGVPQGEEFRVNTYTNSEQTSSKVASMKDGGFVITWQSKYQDGSDWGVYAQQYDSMGYPQGTEFQVNTYITSDQSGQSIAALADGNFVITWHSGGQDGSGYGIFAQRFNSLAMKQGGEFLVNNYTLSNQNIAKIAALSDGGFVITWQSQAQDGFNKGVYAQRYNSTGFRQGQEFQVNTYTNEDQYIPSIATLNGGDFVITWQSSLQDGDSNGIYAQRYNITGFKKGTEFQVNTYTANTQQDPGIGALSDGGFVITWSSNTQDGNSLGSYGQRYNSVNSKVGTEFKTNTFTLGDQSRPKTAGLIDGSYVITWHSYGQDGNGFGIYAQIYNATGFPCTTSVGDDSDNIFVGDDCKNSLRGMGGNDLLEGKAEADVIDGGTGIDTASYVNSASRVNVSLLTGQGYEGDAEGDTLISIENLIGSSYGDILTGDNNNNLLQGGPGADFLDGGLGNDTASYKNSNYAVQIDLNKASGFGGEAEGEALINIENIIGSNFGDTIVGDNNPNTLQGGLGDDTLEGKGGADIIDGGPGTNTASYQLSNQSVSVNLFTKQYSGGDAEGDTLVNIQNIIGSSSSDTLIGDANVNILQAGPGDDTLEGKGGADIIDGGSSTVVGDTASYASSPSSVIIDLSLKQYSGGDAEGDTLINIENIIGTAQADTLTGDANANILQGGDGNDVLQGKGGADILDGGIDIDTASYISSLSAVNVSLISGQGFGGEAEGDRLLNIENIIGSKFGDVLMGDENPNTLQGGTGNDILDGDLGPDILDGGNNIDTANYSSSPTGVIINLSTGQASGGSAAGDKLISIENIIGASLYDNTLTGDANSNMLQGGIGDDVLDGKDSADILDGGGGIDTVTYFNSPAKVRVDLTTGICTGGDAEGDTLINIENLIGSSKDDILRGNDKPNDIQGGTGNDIIEGRGGADTLDGGEGTDTISYANAPGPININLNTGKGSVGHAEGDIIVNFENILGSAFSDSLIGSFGNNKIDGGPGDDILSTGGGNDILIGGWGKDTYKIYPSTASISIEIVDFEADKQEVIDLTAFSNVHKFGDVVINDRSPNTYLSIPGCEITLDNVRASNITTSNFNFALDSSSSKGLTTEIWLGIGAGIFTFMTGLVKLAHSIHKCKQDKAWCFKDKEDPSVISEGVLGVISSTSPKHVSSPSLASFNDIGVELGTINRTTSNAEFNDANVTVVMGNNSHAEQWHTNELSNL